MKQLNIVKVGGNVIDDRNRLLAFLHNFHALPGCKILVHGGGKIATEIGGRMGIESVYVGGRRVTDEATLRLATMVYGGLVNKEIVAGLQASGCNAIGLTGADGNVINAIKRPVADVDYGYVGDVKRDGIDAALLQLFLDREMVPVLAPLTYDGNGGLLNTNADTIAQETATSLADLYQVQLIYCFEKEGVLLNPDDDSSVIAEIREQDFYSMSADGTIRDGMVPKLENAFSAIRVGVKKVAIGSAESLGLLVSGNAGTQIF